MSKYYECRNCGTDITPEKDEDGMINTFGEECEFCELHLCTPCLEKHTCYGHRPEADTTTIELSEAI